MVRHKNDERIRRPVVWVVGASRGIGREIAKQFAFIGCVVCLSSRNARGLRTAAREIAAAGGRAYAFPCDIRRNASVFAIAKEIRKKIGEIEVLVNSAGITVFKSFLDTSLPEFDDIIATNLLGHIACIKAVLPAMVRKKRGWIFNIVSTAAVRTFEGSAAYTATKAGLLGAGRVLREEVKSHNVRVINVLPGATKTEMWSRGRRNMFSHRMMTPKSIAESVLSIFQLPGDVVLEEALIRPLQGDIA